MPGRYTDALRWLYSFADFERGMGYNAKAPFEHGGRRTKTLLSRLGDPQNGMPIVHIAGSKGKGSVCALVAAAAQAAGHRTGLYTQPHLHSFRERFQINRQPIASESFVELTNRTRITVEDLKNSRSLDGTFTTFELSTAMALDWFQSEAVDLAVIEVGLGGRLDATNVVSPKITAVTNIALEHTNVLGPTLPAIAREKAGIAKRDIAMLVSDQAREVLAAIEEICNAKGATVKTVAPLETDGVVAWSEGRATMTARDPELGKDLAIGLAGFHQAQNAGLAYAICRDLHRSGMPIPHNAIQTGFGSVKWPARIELVHNNPPVVIDGAHTIEAVKAVLTTLTKQLQHTHGPVIFGALRDKPIQGMVEALHPYATEFIVIRPSHPRGADAKDLISQVSNSAKAQEANTASDALTQAMNKVQRDEAVLAIGSLAVAADIRAAAGVPISIDPPFSDLTQHAPH